ncbi:MAG TPA: hypothetical protein VKC56_11425 [Gallionellaceae bacterium]|nr:hypothetical protein [Gallionellaceae bacterium]
MKHIIWVVLAWFALAASAHAEGIHCSQQGVDFEVKDHRITFFYAQSSISDPDLANGYSLTCVHHIDNFSQSIKNNEYVLSFNESDDQYGESTRCKVYLTDGRGTFHLYTTNCVSECMKFDYRLKKSGADCHVAK